MGVDLADLWRGRMSFRRLGVILAHLPGDSAYSTAVREAMTPEDWDAVEAEPPSDKHGRWSRTDFLLARAGDHLANLVWMQTDRKSPPPEPLRRPGVKDVAPLNQEQIDYLNRVRELRGGQPDG